MKVQLPAGALLASEASVASEAKLTVPPVARALSVRLIPGAVEPNVPRKVALAALVIVRLPILSTWPVLLHEPTFPKSMVRL